MCEPVGAGEIADRLDVRPATVAQWLQRGLLPEHQWMIGGRKVWDWPVVEEWAAQTGRSGDVDENRSLIDAIAQDRSWPSTSAAAVALGMHYSTAHEVLVNGERLGLVQRVAGRGQAIGWELGPNHPGVTPRK